MTVILKSDVPATVSMGNINGIKGAQDWVAFLDFEGENYTTKIASETKTSYELNDIVIANRGSLSGKPITIDKLGNESLVTSNTQVRTALLKNGRYGVLSEDTNINYFLNTAAPVTQVISLPVSPNDIIISCKGTGSLTISGDVTGLSYTVTQAEGQVFVRNSKTAVCNLTVTVSGAVTHAQVEEITAMDTVSSKITVKSVPEARFRELVEVNPTLLAQILTDPSNFTVVIQTIDFDAIDGTGLLGRSGNRLNLVGSNMILANYAGRANVGQAFENKYFFVGAVRRDSVPYVINSLEVVKPNTPYTLAVAVSTNKAATAINGFLSNPISTDPNFAVTNITFGSGYDSPIALNGLRGIVTKLAIYDRVLSNEELVNLSASWP